MPLPPGRENDGSPFYTLARLSSLSIVRSRPLHAWTIITELFRTMTIDIASKYEGIEVDPYRIGKVSLTCPYIAVAYDT